jgi:hypothetical protein
MQVVPAKGKFLPGESLGIAPDGLPRKVITGAIRPAPKGSSYFVRAPAAAGGASLEIRRQYGVARLSLPVDFASGAPQGEHYRTSARPL